MSDFWRSQGDALSCPTPSSEALAKRILIVDDSGIVRRTIRTGLERSGYVVCGEAADGVEAITKARELKPDLVVMDLVMPGINGVEATSVIRSTMPRLQIIAFTMFEALAKSLTSKLAITSVVSKPEGLTKLVECIQSVLRPSKSGP